MRTTLHVIGRRVGGLIAAPSQSAFVALSGTPVPGRSLSVHRDNFSHHFGHSGVHF